MADSIDGPIRVEYLPLETIKKWPKNPKIHDTGEIEASLRRFGFVYPILIDEKTGMLVAGHGRAETLEQQKRSGAEPPPRVVEKDGQWYVPVVRGVEFNDDGEAQAYAIADNRTVELGGWDDMLLGDALASFGTENLDGVGFSSEDMERIMANVELNEDWEPEPLPPPDLTGNDTRLGRILLVYKDEGERQKWMKRLDLPADLRRTTLDLEDLEKYSS